MTYYPHHCRRIVTNAVVDVVVEEITDPVLVEPVTLQEMKDYLRISITEDDTVISQMITEARQWIEKRCGVLLIQRNVTAIVEVMNSIYLPYGPISKASVVVNNQYDELIDDPALSGLDGGFIALNGYGMFTVTYLGGYTDCPQALKQALKAAVAFNYENRGDELDKSRKPYAMEAKAKSNPYRRTITF